MTQNAINAKNQSLQFVSSASSAVVTCSTIIPADDTIPQITEGNEVLTLTITPKFSTSNLYIKFTGNFFIGTTALATIALFQDSTANALQAQCFNFSAGLGCLGYIQYVIPSGTTSATTFRIRAGASSGNLYFNGGDTGGAIMGGVEPSTFTIEEYL